jgi:hypothetical protein
MPHAMPQLDALDAGALYDHEADADLDLPRRRAVADWGADDLFHHTPRRRRTPTGAASRERRVSGPVPATAATVSRIQDAPSYAPDAPVEPVAAGAAVRELHAAPASRSVAVSGRPERVVARPARPRPPRTVEERIGHHPDHVAAWAVALGLLLIVLAIVSA